MATTLRDVEIKRYRISRNRRNIAVDYVDGTTDILVYSRSIETQLLERYKAQIIAKKNDYFCAKNNIRKNKQFLYAMGILLGISIAVSCVSSSITIPIILAAISSKGVINIVKNTKKVNALKKQVAFADNVDIINKHNEETMTPEEREAGRTPKLFNISRHEEYSNAEARDIINNAGGCDIELRTAKTKAVQKVKSIFHRC